MSEIPANGRTGRPTDLHHRACNLCEAICGIVVEHRGAEVVAIRPDPEDPFSQGHVCPKAVSLADIHADPDRLRRPLRRVGKDWEEIAWDLAFDEVGERLVGIRRRHGKDAIGFYYGNPSSHNYGSALYGTLLFGRVLGTRNRFSATSVDQLPRMLVSRLLYGNQALLPVPDVDRTEYFLVLGANPLVSNGSIMTAPDMSRRLKAIRARGKVVVLDPRRTETADAADEHHFVRPGTDALFLLAALHTLFAERLVRPGRLAVFTDGIPAVEAAVRGFAPERVAEVVGLAPETIRRLAREFAGADRAVCYGRLGTCTQEFGALSTWLIDVLNVVTGNLDRPGGPMFPSPVVDLVPLAERIDEVGHFGRWRSRVRGLPEYGGELPAVVMAEEIETPGEGQIRALITSAGNPVLSTPNGARLERALARLELMVSIDIYLNETTRHAHYILPPTFALEHDHYDLIFHQVAVRNTVRYSPAMVDPGPLARHDWQIFVELMGRLGPLGETPLGRLVGPLARRLIGELRPDRLVDWMIRTGPRGDRFNPFSSGLNLAKIRRAPHGIDLGPLKSGLPEKLRTADRRIQLAPTIMLDDLGRLEARLAAFRDELAGRLEGAGATGRGQRPLRLIGRRELRSNNSWGHNSIRMVRGKIRCTLRMHPDDARSRGLDHGQRVRVRSRVGEVVVPLELSDALMPGVVSLPHGWGHDRPGIRLGVAQAHPGASINDLTDEALVDALSGNASVNGTPVTVHAA